MKQKNIIKNLLRVTLLLFSSICFSQCWFTSLVQDIETKSNEFKNFINTNEEAFTSYEILYNEASALKNNVDELTLVSKNLEAIKSAKGYLNWKALKGAMNWKPIQKIANKYPTEVMPLDGQLWGVAEIENGAIKQISNKGNTFNDVDFVITTSGELKIGNKHHFLGKGSEVEAAGTIKTVNGKIKKISNSSGHYFPTIDETNKFPEIFRQLGIENKIFG